MQAEEPPLRASTPVPAVAELSVTPEALRGSSPAAAWGPEGREG